MVSLGFQRDSAKFLPDTASSSRRSKFGCAAWKARPIARKNWHSRLPLRGRGLLSAVRMPRNGLSLRVVRQDGNRKMIVKRVFDCFIPTIVASIAAGFFCWSGAFAQVTDLPAVVDAEGNEIPGSLASLEKVTLGGIDQWILIRAQDTSKPVLLFLHGGPGGAVMPWVDLFQPVQLEANFVVVHWDQRGAGKSYNQSLKAEDLSFDNFVSDTLELTDLLRERFDQGKIFLSGISWGSTSPGTLLSNSS